MSQANEHTMRRFVAELINDANFDAMGEIIHADYVYRSPGEVIEGQEGLKAFLGGYHSAFPDLHMSIDEMVVAGDSTATFFTLTGTHKGELMGIPPTGKSIQVSGVVRSRFVDGKIADEWEIVDQLALLTQLGVVSLPG